MISNYKKSVPEGVMEGPSSKLSIVAHGTIDNFGRWHFDTNNCLHIDGNGKMPDWFFAEKTPWFSFREQILSVRISHGVTSIGMNVFWGLSNLQKVTIPDSVTSVGSSAFNFCGRLTEIDLPDSITCIKDSAFSHCSALRRITLPTGITDIYNETFYSCTSLQEIILPYGVTTIGHEAFSYSALRSISIPETVTGIGSDVFRYCRDLWEVIIPDSVTEIRSGIFYGCGRLSKVTMPARFRCADFEEKYGCSPGIVTFTAASEVKGYIDGFGIWYMDAQSCLHIDGSGPMPDWDYKHKAPWYEIKDKILSVHISEGITSVGALTFVDCDYLKEVVLPDSITSIGNYAFDNCDRLKEIHLPHGISTIGYKA